MVPGEILHGRGELTLNEGRRTLTVLVANTGDRPVQVGSHYHFFETNEALAFDRPPTVTGIGGSCGGLIVTAGAS